MNDMNMNGGHGAIGGEPLQGFNNGGPNGANGNFSGNISNKRVLRTWAQPPNGVTRPESRRGDRALSARLLQPSSTNKWPAPSAF